MREGDREKLYANLFCIIIITITVLTTVLHVESRHASCSIVKHMHGLLPRQENSLNTQNSMQERHSCEELAAFAGDAVRRAAKSMRPKQPSQTDSYRQIQGTQAFVNSRHMCFRQAFAVSARNPVVKIM